jgi:3-methyladenine DNA glycosylase AlkD
MRPASPSSLRAVRRDLRAEANPDDAIHLQRFFKTGPGQYGAGDRFLGVRVPALRRLVRAHRELPLPDVLALLQSKWHEERLLALLLLVDRYRRSDDDAKQTIHDAYLANTRYINNWDLVDASAEHIIGPHHDPNDMALLDQLCVSASVWERRIAMLATFHWIKRRQFAPALRVAERLVNDDHDLIHKAVGWMLREIGNRDRDTEEAFLRVHCPIMPRTMLRYAIEKFPPLDRRGYLTGQLESADGARRTVRNARRGNSPRPT